MMNGSTQNEKFQLEGSNTYRYWLILKLGSWLHAV